MKPLSAAQVRCVIEATIDPLMPFRRGFARSKAGPFFFPGMISGLVERGDLRLWREVRGRRRILVSARAI
jgi:hypothetical protein